VVSSSQKSSEQRVFEKFRQAITFILGQEALAYMQEM
jgi:hypothetical protein